MWRSSCGRGDRCVSASVRQCERGASPCDGWDAASGLSCSSMGGKGMGVAEGTSTGAVSTSAGGRTGWVFTAAGEGAGGFGGVGVLMVVVGIICGMWVGVVGIAVVWIGDNRLGCHRPNCVVW